jgi:hypothetical protein
MSSAGSRSRVRSSARSRVDRELSVPDDVAKEFLQIYRDAFAPLEVLAPARQSLTDDEFLHEMQDPGVVKFVARDGDGEIVALATMATDLSTVPWISVPFYAHRFPEHHARGAIYYFGCLLVHADRQRGPWAAVLVRDLADFLAEHRAVAAFDCCGLNTESTKLPEVIARASRRIARFTTEELDQQRYFAYTVEGYL